MSFASRTWSFKFDSRVAVGHKSETASNWQHPSWYSGFRKRHPGKASSHRCTCTPRPRSSGFETSSRAATRTPARSPSLGPHPKCALTAKLFCDCGEIAFYYQLCVIWLMRTWEMNYFISCRLIRCRRSQSRNCHFGIQADWRSARGRTFLSCPRARHSHRG